MSHYRFGGEDCSTIRLFEIIFQFLWTISLIYLQNQNLKLHQSHEQKQVTPENHQASPLITKHMRLSVVGRKQGLHWLLRIESCSYLHHQLMGHGQTQPQSFK